MPAVSHLVGRVARELVVARHPADQDRWQRQVQRRLL
jgi:hypothetical protein